MKVIVATVILMICSVINSLGQAKKITALKIGDQLPEITFHHMIGYEDSIVKISDFKGKILILDYWATWCHSCIDSFSHSDSLQTHFGNAIKIMLVDSKDTRDNEHNIQGFYERRSKSNPDFKLPSICLDTVLNRLFPHWSIPHCVWINKKGTVIAITGSEEVTAVNIEKAIKDDEVHLPVKAH